METEILFYLTSGGWTLLPNPDQDVEVGFQKTNYLARVLKVQDTHFNINALVNLIIDYQNETFVYIGGPVDPETQATLNLFGYRDRDAKDPFKDSGIKPPPSLCGRCGAIDRYEPEEGVLVCQTCGTPAEEA